jgi:hypothetical protein
MSLGALLDRMKQYAGLTEVSASERKILSLQDAVAKLLKDSLGQWGEVTYQFRSSYFNRDTAKLRSLSVFMPSVAERSNGYSVLLAFQQTPYRAGIPSLSRVMRQSPAHKAVGMSRTALAEDFEHDVVSDSGADDMKAEDSAFNAAARVNVEKAVALVSKGLSKEYVVSLSQKGEEGADWNKVFWAKLHISKK